MLTRAAGRGRARRRSSTRSVNVIGILLIEIVVSHRRIDDLQIHLQLVTNVGQIEHIQFLLENLFFSHGLNTNRSDARISPACFPSVRPSTVESRAAPASTTLDIRDTDLRTSRKFLGSNAG